MSPIRAWEIGVGFVEYTAISFTGPSADISLVGDRRHKSSVLPVEPESRRSATFRHRVERRHQQPTERPRRVCACGQVVKHKGRICARCRYRRDKRENLTCRCGKPCARRPNGSTYTRCATCPAFSRRRSAA